LSVSFRIMESDPSFIPSPDQCLNLDFVLWPASAWRSGARSMANQEDGEDGDKKGHERLWAYGSDVLPLPN
jgi:hypothetical protein